MASTTLLLPQPLGPTIAVTPMSKASSDRSGKLLKPAISRRFKRICEFRGSSAQANKKAAFRTCHRPRPGSGWVRFERKNVLEAKARQRPFDGGAQHSAPKRNGPWGRKRRSV